MRKEYLKPELSVRRISFIEDALVISSTDPMYTDAPIPTGGDNVPDDDPFA